MIGVHMKLAMLRNRRGRYRSASANPTLQGAVSGRAQLAKLTGIRGVAAFWVMLYHVQEIATRYHYVDGNQVPEIIKSGWIGVDLFFVLSGFMLMHSSGERFREIKFGLLSEFAVTRFLRVYPLSFATLILVGVLVRVYPSFAREYQAAVLGNLSPAAFALTALLATRWIEHSGEWNEPVWSLSVEILGYAAFPFLAYLAGRTRSFTVALSAAAVAITYVLFFQSLSSTFGINDISLHSAQVRMFGFFTAGIYLRTAAGLVEHRPIVVKMITYGAVVAIVVLGSFSDAVGVAPIAFASLIYILYFPSAALENVLTCGAAMFLGRISFPLYLIHVMPLLAIGHYSFINGLSKIAFFGCIAFTIVVNLSLSWMLHELVERPFHRLARRQTRGCAGSAGCGPVYG